MSNIELVIKIDEDIYKARQRLVANQKRMVDKVDIAIANGTPLPKGHGSLVDVKEVEEYLNDIQLELDGWGDTVTGVEIAKARIGLDSIPTIIEEVKERG